MSLSNAEIKKIKLKYTLLFYGIVVLPVLGFGGFFLNAMLNIAP